MAKGALALEAAPKAPKPRPQKPKAEPSTSKTGPWTNAEVLRLRTMAGEGRTLGTIANRLGRTTGSVRAKAASLRGVRIRKPGGKGLGDWLEQESRSIARKTGSLAKRVEDHSPDRGVPFLVRAAEAIWKQLGRLSAILRRHRKFLESLAEAAWRRLPQIAQLLSKIIEALSRTAGPKAAAILTLVQKALVVAAWVVNLSQGFPAPG